MVALVNSYMIYKVFYFLVLLSPVILLVGSLSIGENSSLSGLECVVHQNSKDNDKTFNQDLNMVLGSK